MINGFNLAHLNKPVLDVLRSGNEDSMSMVLSLTKNLQT
jgi:hypothetical protein